MTKGSRLDASGYHSSFLQTIASSILPLAAVAPKPLFEPGAIRPRHVSPVARACNAPATDVCPGPSGMQILTAVGLNVLRLGAWFLKTSRAKTRITPHSPG